ncbi:MAG: hypothetical protein JSW55_13620 [Chloroflexota bacterium]|nr:MAG: hypothetical protein JSW55_13620 [Chloroflexota bacterium]
MYRTGEGQETHLRFSAAEEPSGPSNMQIVCDEPSNTIDRLKSGVADAQAAGVFSQRQASSLNRKLNRAGSLVQDGRYWLAALTLDLFALQGLLIAAPGEWEIEPNIALDMGQALRGWAAPPD